MSGAVVVEKGLAVQIRGYRLALSRLKEAVLHEDDRPDDVYISLAEAVEWFTIIAERAQLTGDVHVQALNFARNRAHHQWASVTYFDQATATWLWRPTAQLPMPGKQKFQGARLMPWYERHLADRPVLDVFHRLEPMITAIAPEANR